MTATPLHFQPPTADAVLHGLDPEQRQVATALRGPVCVLAGAGTGKTRAITHRIAYGVRAGIMQPASVLAVTFTARAAGEMRGRLRQLGVGGVQARTFHSAALRQLRYFWPKAVGGEPPRVVERKAPFVVEAAGRCRMRLDKGELWDATKEIEWAKVTQAAPEDYPAALAAAGRDAPRDPAELARIYATYEQVKRERAVIDFEDVLLLTVGVLQDRPDIADQVRAQYRHFVVDEYQDVSPLQQRLLQAWLGERDSVCVVGDASQTIYSFAGATPRFLLNFRTRHPNATVVKLVRDYRSTPQVVHLANGLLGQAPTGGSAGWTAEHRLELLAQREAGPEPVYLEYPDDPAEADGTAGRIRKLLNDGVKASEIAVLFRTNGQSEGYEHAFADSGIPYQVRGAERFFERPEVREAGLLLRGAARAGGPPAGGTGADAMADVDMPAQVSAVLGSQGWSSQPPAGSGAARERWESLAALVRLAGDLASAQPDATLADFVAELAERANAQHAPTVEGVTLASLHAAKGLEWDAVFLVGLNEGMLPITYARTDEQVEEERRLLYVGVTRARCFLTLSWTLSRSPGGRANRKPCRFLDGLRPGAPGRPHVTAPGRSRTGDSASTGVSRRRGPVRCRVCGRTLSEAVERKLGRCQDCPSELDEALYERLRDWRGTQAKAQGCPAYCVFTDATLTAIAESRPTSVAELIRIPGVGKAKLDRYGAAVLARCAGAEVAESSDDEPDQDGDEKGSAGAAAQLAEK